MAEEIKVKCPYLHLTGSDADPIYYRTHSDKPDHYEPLTNGVYLNNDWVVRIDEFEVEGKPIFHIHMANGEFYRVKNFTVKNM